MGRVLSPMVARACKVARKARAELQSAQEALRVVRALLADVERHEEECLADADQTTSVPDHRAYMADANQAAHDARALRRALGVE